jgi:predicted HTH domain antitoxin
MIGIEEMPSTMQITIDMPEGAFSALRLDPDKFVKEMRTAAAMKWYENGLISQSKAAEVAAMSRQEFLDAMGRFGVSPFQVTDKELEEECMRG